jgi:hypothetical protein
MRLSRAKSKYETPPLLTLRDLGVELRFELEVSGTRAPTKKSELLNPVPTFEGETLLPAGGESLSDVAGPLEKLSTLPSDVRADAPVPLVVPGEAD